MIPCVDCNGQDSADCATCGGAGHHELTECPDRIITPDVAELVRLVRFMDKGIPPIAGGTLDQTAAFLSGMSQVHADDAMWELDRLKREKSNG